MQPLLMVASEIYNLTGWRHSSRLVFV
jgi:hypothetical protein